MKKKIFALFVACAFVINGIGAVFADTNSNKKAGQTSQLVALLPASDGVMTLDVQRLLNDALPQILSGNQLMLSKVLGKIDEIKNQTGIDLRQFQQVAVGVATKQLSAKEIDFEPVVLARGTFNAGALLAVAKVASKGKYREEKIGDKTVYVFTMKEVVKKDKPQNKPAVKDSWFDKAIDRMFTGLSRELAVTSYDNNTLAIGSVARVRETLQTKTRIDSQFLDLIYRKQNVVMSFGANLPNGLSGFIDLDNDELGKNIDAIRQIYGTLDVVGENTNLQVTARTSKPEQAQGLQETLEGLQMVGKALIGGSKSVDKKVYGRMIDNAKISRNGNEIMLNLQVPQTDINVLIGEKK
ncbi:MAG: hypothetical protein ACR2MG_00230 [Pyrinomonadaceae bacterium]